MSVVQRIEFDDVRREIRKLAAYLGLGNKWDQNPVQYLHPHVSIDWRAPQGRHGADASLTLEEGGRVRVDSWYESHHNGSSYGEEHAFLEGEVAEKALVEARDRLLLAAIEKARVEIDETKTKVLETRARAEALDHLLALGVIEK
jgi:hypothetical protein